MRGRAFLTWTTGIGLASLCAGCGPVNFSSMAPKVWKPAALFALDGKVAGWTPAYVDELAKESNVVTKAVYVAPSNLQDRLQNEVTVLPDVGLFVIVSSQPPDSTILSYAAQHPQARLEWVGPSNRYSTAVNLRQLTPNEDSVGYLIGWLASSTAQSRGNGPIGWDLTGGATAAQIQAALGGSFVANASVVNEVVSASNAGAVPATIVPAPRVVIVDHAPSSAEASWFAQSGSDVFSLTDPPGGGMTLGAWPATPGPHAVLPDLSAFATLKWRAGQSYADGAPWIDVNASGLAPAAIRGLASQEAVIRSNPDWPSNAWSMVPDAVRQGWGGILPS